MTTKNEETLLGIEKCSELLLDKPFFFSLICHNSIFFELWSQLAINDFGKNYPEFWIKSAKHLQRKHVADTASFSKFFLRLKGCSPKEYRTGNVAKG